MCATTFRSSHTRYAMAVSRIISTTATLTTVRSRKVCVSESLSMSRLAQQREGQYCPSLGAARNWRTCLIFAWPGAQGPRLSRSSAQKIVPTDSFDSSTELRAQLFWLTDPEVKRESRE